MNKLTIEHLAPYLPYATRVCIGKNERNLTAISLDSPFVFVSAWKGSRAKEMVSIEDIKPILRPLSDLTKEIEHNEHKFIPMTVLSKRFEMNVVEHCFIEQNAPTDFRWIKTFRYEVVQALISFHFDVFGLIGKGLAVDINTLGAEVGL